MKKIKILTVVGTRPEIIRLSRIIDKFDQYFDHILVNTDQNYDKNLNQIFFDDLNIRKPNYNLKIKKENSIDFIGTSLIEVNKILIKEKPDAFFILGDTNSALTVIAAKKNKIPIFHMEAGNRCFDLRVPEEINRKTIDHLSDINLTYSKNSKQYLINEGLDPDKIIIIGSPLPEVFKFFSKKINNSKILRKSNIRKNEYFLASIHRDENVENIKNFEKILEFFNLVIEKYKKPILVSTHPRTMLKIKQQKQPINEKIIFAKPLNFSDYNSLQINALAVLSDSGTITEESAILNLTSLNIREAQERPEGMEEATVIMTGTKISNLFNALEIVLKQKKNKVKFNKIDDYKSENVSEKIPRIILSYIDQINQKIWFKK
jgi:UDP-N-acetylglucosamine 2-epimerase